MNSQLILPRGTETEQAAAVLVATASIVARTDRSIVFARWRPHVHQSNTRFRGPTWVCSQTPSRSVQSFMQGSPIWQTHSSYFKLFLYCPRTDSRHRMN